MDTRGGYRRAVEDFVITLAGGLMSVEAKGVPDAVLLPKGLREVLASGAVPGGNEYLSSHPALGAYNTAYHKHTSHEDSFGKGS